MDLPYGTFYRPRQEKLIAKDEWAIIWIKTDDKYPNNKNYQIEDRKFETDIAPFIHGDWEEFDRFFRLDPQSGISTERWQQSSLVVFSRAEHGGGPRLPNITVVPNLLTTEYRGLAKRWEVFGCTMGDYNLPHPDGCRVQQVYEFQSYGMMVLDRQEGCVEMWVAQDGDKVAVPDGCHMTLYNLGDKDNPLITLDFAGPERNRPDKGLVNKCGPILLAYYNDFQVVFVLNHLYINNRNHQAGVRIAGEVRNLRDRRVRIARGVRLELGRLLYEELTQNHDLIGQFSRLGIRIRQATPEAVLEPLESGKGARMYFSMPLVSITKQGTDVYKYFFPKAEQESPGRPVRKPVAATAPEEARGQALPYDNTPENPSPLNRPLVVVVEGVGDWVEKAYRKLFLKKVSEDGRKLSVFYADDTRWKKRPKWADPNPENSEYDLEPWEIYLDKADLDDFDRYRILRPDVVFVVTPDFTHSAISRWWLGKAPIVFVEKPFDSHVKNVDDLLVKIGQERSTVIFGLDHYQFYALPVHGYRSAIDGHLDGSVARVEFYLTENRPIEEDRVRSLQYGLTLDLLPHFIALLTYFGNVSTVDEIRVIEAAQYHPLDAVVGAIAADAEPNRPRVSDVFYNETYSRVEFTFQDYSNSGARVPCLAVVGKGFSQSVKYLEVTGHKGNAIRVDLNEKPAGGDPNYPWDSLFYLHGERLPLPTGAEVRVVDCPYSRRKLRILDDPNNPERFRQKLERKRYDKLLDDLLNHTDAAVASTLSLTEGREIVLALDRIWWAIQATRPWPTGYSLLNVHPLDGPLISKADQFDSMWRPESVTDSPEKDMIRPIRSRGANPIRGNIVLEHLPGAPVRTRGDILNGEVQAPGAANSPAQESLFLSSLVERLRKQVQDLPLTILLHNWKNKTSEFFLDVLTPWLLKSDALWLIPLGYEQASTPLPEMEGAVSLNLARDIDERIYSNLIGDIVFFPALEAAEAEHAYQFTNRARATVVNRQGAFANDILRRGCEAGLTMYIWSGEAGLVGYKCPQDGGGATQPESPPDPPPESIEHAGEMLKAVATHIERLFLRRNLFRGHVGKIKERYPDRSDIAEALVRQADKHQWPYWALESLAVYVSLGPLPDGGKRALVWHYILDCVPESYSYEVAAKLLDNQMVEAHMPAETAKLVDSIAEIFEHHLRANPFASDRSVIGAVINAMQQIEIRHPEAAQTARKAREKVLTESKVM